jgi:hypothetical protein
LCVDAATDRLAFTSVVDVDDDDDFFLDAVFFLLCDLRFDDDVVAVAADDVAASSALFVVAALLLLLLLLLLLVELLDATEDDDGADVDDAPFFDCLAPMLTNDKRREAKEVKVRLWVFGSPMCQCRYSCSCHVESSSYIIRQGRRQPF